MMITSVRAMEPGACPMEIVRARIRVREARRKKVFVEAVRQLHGGGRGTTSSGLASLGHLPLKGKA